MIVFLLGIPGCGKSAFYKRLVKKLEDARLFRKFFRIDDFPKLWAIFKEDEKTGDWKRCRPTDDGGYKVTDDAVWNDILIEVNKDVIEIIKTESSDSVLYFVEFSRPDYVDSMNNNFSKEILDQALAVYVDVPFDICWERNVRRHKLAMAEGTDDHLVSREEMEKTYGSDDKDNLEKGLPMPVIFINPDSKDEHDFRKLEEGVEKVFSVIERIKDNSNE